MFTMVKSGFVSRVFHFRQLQTQGFEPTAKAWIYVGLYSSPCAMSSPLGPLHWIQCFE